MPPNQPITSLPDLGRGRSSRGPITSLPDLSGRKPGKKQVFTSLPPVHQVKQMPGGEPPLKPAIPLDGVSAPPRMEDPKQSPLRRWLSGVKQEQRQKAVPTREDVRLAEAKLAQQRRQEEARRYRAEQQREAEQQATEQVADQIGWFPVVGPTVSTFLKAWGPKGIATDTFQTSSRTGSRLVAQMAGAGQAQNMPATPQSPAEAAMVEAIRRDNEARGGGLRNWLRELIAPVGESRMPTYSEFTGSVPPSREVARQARAGQIEISDRPTTVRDAFWRAMLSGTFEDINPADPLNVVQELIPGGIVADGLVGLRRGFNVLGDEAAEAFARGMDEGVSELARPLVMSDAERTVIRNQRPLPTRAEVAQQRAGEVQPARLPTQQEAAARRLAEREAAEEATRQAEARTRAERLAPVTELPPLEVVTKKKPIADLPSLEVVRQERGPRNTREPVGVQGPQLPPKPTKLRTQEEILAEQRPGFREAQATAPEESLQRQVREEVARQVDEARKAEEARILAEREAELDAQRRLQPPAEQPRAVRPDEPNRPAPALEVPGRPRTEAPQLEVPGRAPEGPAPKLEVVRQEPRARKMVEPEPVRTPERAPDPEVRTATSEPGPAPPAGRRVDRNSDEYLRRAFGEAEDSPFYQPMQEVQQRIRRAEQRKMDVERQGRQALSREQRDANMRAWDQADAEVKAARAEEDRLRRQASEEAENWASGQEAATEAPRTFYSGSAPRQASAPGPAPQSPGKAPSSGSAPQPSRAQQATAPTINMGKRSLIRSGARKLWRSIFGKKAGVTTRQQTVRDLAEALQTRGIYGKQNKNLGRAGGFYDGEQGYAQVASQGDHRTAYHEYGHAMDVEGKVTDGWDPDAVDELNNLGATRPASSYKPGMSAEYQRREGFAELFVDWLEGESEQTAPKAHAALEKWLDDRPDLAAEMRRIRESIRLTQEAPATQQVLQMMRPQRKRGWFDPERWQQNLFDQYLPFKRLSEYLARLRGEKRLKPSEDPYVMAELMDSAAGNTIQEFLGWDRGGHIGRAVDQLAGGHAPAGIGRAQGTPMKVVRQADGSFTREPIAGAKSFSQITEPIRDKPEMQERFAAYWMAKRADEVRRAGKATPITEEMARRIFDENSEHAATFDRMLEELNQLRQHALAYARDLGYLSDESFSALSKSTSYVPMHRILEPEVGAIEETILGTGKGLQAADPIKRMKGSMIDEFEDSMGNFGRNLAAIIYAAEKNVVGQTLAKLLDDGHRLEGLITEAKPPVGVISISPTDAMSARRLKQELTDLGVDVEDFSIGELRAMLELMPQKSVAHPRRANANELLVKVRQGDKTRWLRLAPDLYDSFTALRAEQLPAWANALGFFADLLRGGVTRTVGFALRQLVKDPLSYATVSRFSGKPYHQTLKGLAAYLQALFGDKKAQEALRKLAAHGGQFDARAGVLTSDGYKRVARRAFRSVVSGRRGRGAKIVNALEVAKETLDDFFQMYDDLFQSAELVNRQGEFDLAVQKLREQHPDWSDGDILMRAAWESKDLLNFSRSGLKVKILRRIIPFASARANALARLGTAFKENPVGTAARGLANLTLPTLALWWLNKDDPEYQALPQEERDTYWHISKSGDAGDRWIRIPKPGAEALMFSTGIEWALEASRENEATWQHMVGQAVTELNPLGSDILPLGPAAMLMLELPANYSYSRGGKIVPQHLEAGHPLNQANERTTATAKYLGEVTGYSPMKIDYAIRKLTGSMGMGTVEKIVDPVVAGATGTALPVEQRRTAAQSLGFESRPGRQESEDRFDALLRELEQEEDLKGIDGMDPARANQLEAMKEANKELKQVRKEYYSERDEARRRELRLQIRELTERFTPDSKRVQIGEKP